METGQKGTKANPYTMAEYESMANAGTWEGGFVMDDSGEAVYMMREVTVKGSSSDSGSETGSSPVSQFEFSDGSYTPHNPEDDDDDDDDDDENGGIGGGPDGGNDMGDEGWHHGGGGHQGGENNGITLDINSHTEISEYSKNLLRSLKGYTGKIVVTSTCRTPERQALAMLQNIKKTGVEKQKLLYGRYGDMVIDTYDPSKTDEENIKTMTNKIYELGPSKVSKHCFSEEEYKKTNIIDISRSSLSNVDDFIKAIKRADSRIILFNETRNNCVHIEIPQP